MMTDLQHFIGGQRVAGASARTAAVFNPATGEQAARVPLASAAEVDAAVKAAAAAFPAWASSPPLRRARILMRFLRLLEDNADALAAAITAEHGKVLSDARGEVTRGLEVVRVCDWRAAIAEGRIH
jgi:malonate-semialdehyde dehydrogenase (acetylating)/methylmalonate-semialdehyde dehydrogenase